MFVGRRDHVCPLRRRLISPAELVRLETVLMDGLGFFLMVYTPLHSLPAAIRHAKHALKLPGRPEATAW